MKTALLLVLPVLLALSACGEAYVDAAGSPGEVVTAGGDAPPSGGAVVVNSADAPPPPSGGAVQVNAAPGDTARATSSRGAVDVNAAPGDVEPEPTRGAVEVNAR